MTPGPAPVRRPQERGAPAGPTVDEVRNPSGQPDRPGETGSAATPPAAVPAASYTTRMAALALVLAMLVVSFAYPLRAFMQQRGLLAEARAEEAALKSAVADLQAELDRWDDPIYVRTQARERLNLVLPGEVGLIVLGTQDIQPPEQQRGPVVPEVGAGSQWWLRLWAGVVEAGSPAPGTKPDAQPPTATVPPAE